MISSWNNVYDCWDFILGECEISRPSVLLLEGRCPKLSVDDRVYLQHSFEAGVLFSEISSSQLRQQCWARVCEYECVIPTVGTSFRDRVYLEHLAKAVRFLVSSGNEPSPYWTTASRLRRGFDDSVTEARGAHHASLQASTRFEVAYRKLWLLIMRRWPHLDEAGPLKRTQEMRRGQSSVTEDRDHCQRAVAQEAYRLGFRTPQIDHLRSDRDAVSIPSEPDNPAHFVTDDSTRKQKVSQRFGVPTITDFDQDRETLHYEAVLQPCIEIGGDVTSFFTRRCFLLRITNTTVVHDDFFGSPRSPSPQDDPDPPSTPHLNPAPVLGTLSPAPSNEQEQRRDGRGRGRKRRHSSGILPPADVVDDADDRFVLRIFQGSDAFLVEESVAFRDRLRRVGELIVDDHLFYDLNGRHLHPTMIGESEHIREVWVRPAYLDEARFLEELGFSVDRPGRNMAHHSSESSL